MGSSVFRFCLMFLAVFQTQKMRLCLIGARDLSLNFITWDDFRVVKSFGKMNSYSNQKVLVVAKDGRGDSKTVQGAVDLVPNGNRERVKIVILPGVYREKVVVPYTKPYISFIGNHSTRTIISWNSKASDLDHSGTSLGTFNSSTVAIESAFFCARGIAFVNTSPVALPGARGQQAVALRISGDRAMFFRCSFLGSQDTLFDHEGRHYFYKCYIQGSIDFIFGKGRSLYQKCTIQAIASSYGAITASQRNDLWENSGFAFTHCKLMGSGSNYLGRAWGRYATVVFSYCNFDDIINPQGWYDWGDPSRTRTVLFGEYNCKGRGASLRGRVPWAKALRYEDAKPFLSRGFIGGDSWLKL